MITLSPATKEKVEKYHSHFFKIMKNSLKLRQENILIICDQGEGENMLSLMLGYGYYHAALKNGHNASLLYQDVKKGFMQADSMVINTLLSFPKDNVIIVTVSNKLGRFGEEKSFRGFCKDQGHRFLSATGLGSVHPQNFDLFMEAMNVNYARMRKKGEAIKKKWDKAKEIRVKTNVGTDLVFDVTGMAAIANIGEYFEKGQGGNMPAGEVYIPPRGSCGVNGTLVIDGSLKLDHGAMLLDEPVTLVIKDGRVISLSGKYAALLEETFRKYEDRAKYPERVRMVAELAVGLNPGAVLIGSTIMDEKVLGTAHVAIGSNYWFGGEIRTIYHGDQVLKNPVFYVDGEKMEL